MSHQLPETHSPAPAGHTRTAYSRASTRTNAHGSAEPALRIRKLVKDFRASRSFREKHPERITPMDFYRAVNSVNLDVYPGEVVVLLGANGAGKTTTLSCAQGMVWPTRGSVELLGENPVHATPELRARVGIMLQDGGLPNAMKPIPLLKHVASMYRDPMDVDMLVERLGIEAFNGTNIRRLSGGQKQRVAFAAALIGKPDVLFLDEPSAGLDPQSRNVVFDIIREQRAAGTAIVLTTHLLDDAQKLADYVYIMEDGAIASEGPIHQLLTGDGSMRLRFSLRSDCPELSELFPDDLSKGLSLSVSEPYDESAPLLPGEYEVTGAITGRHMVEFHRALAQRNLMPVHLELTAKSLEDVFLEISGEEIR